MTRTIRYLLCLGIALPAHAAVPEDYASGLVLDAEAGKAVQELVLPDAVYAGVQNSDLADLRVFNRAGTAVPHALCGPAAATATPGARLPLPVFPLKEATHPQGGDQTHIDISTSDEVELKVRPGEPQPETSAVTVAAYVIDARAAFAPLQALHLNWSSADGASELRVRVEASDDLDHWRVLVAQTTLLHADAGGQTLQRTSIMLPPGRYSYLRLRRDDDGPQPQLDAVVGETAGAEMAEPPFYFEATPLESADAGVFLFDSGHLAPVTSARVLLPEENMSLHMVLQSRARADAGWMTRWNGEVFNLRDANGPRSNADLGLRSMSDRWWRLQIVRGGESLGAGKPKLQLGYRPGRLRFLAQGDGPYTLAYGSIRAEAPPAQSCEGLLAELPRTELSAMLGHAQIGATRSLGGDNVLQPAPPPRPWKKFLLWIVLGAGALLLLLMALNLMRRLREDTA